MHGLITKLTIVEGKREEMVRVLREGSSDMPGCLSYVVANDASSENVIWVTEVWDSVSSHEASLSLQSVRDALTRAKQMISGFGRWRPQLQSGELDASLTRFIEFCDSRALRRKGWLCSPLLEVSDSDFELARST